MHQVRVLSIAPHGERALRASFQDTALDDTGPVIPGVLVLCLTTSDDGVADLGKGHDESDGGQASERSQ